MRIFFCPRFFRSRASSASSDSPQTSRYQLDRLDVPTTPDRHPEGISSSREHAHYPDRQSDSSEGFSDRLRRRFSRETHGSHMRSRKGDKKTGHSIFPFTTMTFNNNPNQIASADIGSSLISERGYDSDAQYITTPKQTGQFKEELHPRPGVWRNMSPLDQPYHGADQEAEYGRSPVPMDESGRMGNYNYGGHREMERSQTSWHSRNHPRWGPPQSHSGPRNVYEHPRGRVGSPCPSIASSVSLDTTADGKSATHGFYYPRQRQGLKNTSMPGNYPRDDRQRDDRQILPIKIGGQSLNLPNCTPGLSQPYTTSAESVAYPPSQISVMKRRQRHQREQESDGPSIHLVDMNIPRALASHSMSPHILSQNQSLDENGWSNRSEVQGTTQPGHEYSKMEAPKTPIHNGGKTSKEPSSSYSRKTSISSEFPGYRWEPKAFNNSSASPDKGSTGTGFEVAPNCRQAPRPREMHTGQSSELSPRDHRSADTVDTQKSKFIGQPSPDRSVSSPVPCASRGTNESLASPRKVSVGWMSGGRRLGYGYTMVPADESAEQPSHGNPTTPVRTDGMQGSERANVSHSKQGSEKMGKISLRIGDSTYDISNIIQRLNPRHRAATSAEITNRSDTASCDSVTSSLWEKLGYRKRSHNELDTDVDKKSPWSHFCGVGLDQTSREPPILSKDSSTSAAGEDTGHLALRRAKTILAKGRSVSAIARDLEHSIVQNKGTRVMKYKIRDLRNRRRKTDDDGPIFTDNRKGSYGNSQDGEERESSPDVIGVGQNEAEEPKEPSFDLVSDDWIDKIHECLDIQPIPE
ncbi:uncharacterized protein KD926_005368 [Aspergillus affinis]|uniref:uncharacterized protein n=1 Tax=Aspergillus affinis TaxID=1070780 RepID=UPI0022FDC370|nr:uncharacterized protein KD926_005368 [Aspergillus affinis]KAI9042514.1 hypothetical protein KD926_005368 [Aspergillus affinis]